MSTRRSARPRLLPWAVLLGLAAGCGDAARSHNALSQTDGAPRDATPGGDIGSGPGDVATASDVAPPTPDANAGGDGFRGDGPPVDAALPDGRLPDMGVRDALPPPPPDAATLPPPVDARPVPDRVPPTPVDAAPVDAFIPPVDAAPPPDGAPEPPFPFDGPPPPDAAPVDAFVPPVDALIAPDGPPPPPEGCIDCHGDLTSAAPPRDTLGNVDTGAPGVGAHRSHLRNIGLFRPGRCEDCHVVPVGVDDLSHADGLPAELVWGEIPQADGANPVYAGGTCTNYCHGETLNGGSIGAPVWTTVDGSQAFCGSCHGMPPGGGHPQSNDCGSCHRQVMTPAGAFLNPALHVDGIVEVDIVGCVGCHDLPPQTGSHMLHSSLAEGAYGGLGTAANLANPADYAFGCGYCHPLDAARHRDGTVQVELFNAAAPAGNFKGRNPAAAYVPGPQVQRDDHGLPYTFGTCNNVACHSGMVTTSGAVPEPESAGFPFVGYPVVYPPYEVNRRPVSRPATWGAPNAGCDSCHGYPPRTTWPDTDGGAGESHSYIDAQGSEDLHFFNHAFDPLGCRTCHHDTVTDVGDFVRDANDITTLADVPIADYRKHVNGFVDVIFDKIDPLPYNAVPNLETAAWDPVRRSCTNVSCHKEQTEVFFGTPYRFENWVECDNCHRY